jgi:hypothetical protein
MKIIYEILSPAIVTVGILAMLSFSDIVFSTLEIWEVNDAPEMLLIGLERKETTETSHDGL